LNYNWQLHNSVSRTQLHLELHSVELHVKKAMDEGEILNLRCLS